METFSSKINIYSEQNELLESIQEPMVYSMRISELNEIVLEALDLKINEESLKFKYTDKSQMELDLNEVFSTYRKIISNEISENEFFTIEAFLEFNDEEKDYETQEEGVKIISSRTQSDQIVENRDHSTVKHTSISKDESSFDLLESSKKEEVLLETVIKTEIADEKFEELFNLAKLQADRKMFLNATKTSVRALRRLNAIIKEDNSKITHLSAKISLLLGFLNSLQGKLDMSQEYIQTSLETFFELDGVDSIYTACTTANLGSMFYEIGDYPQSLEFQRSAKKMLKGLKGQECELQLASIYYNIGIIMLKLKKNEAALNNLKTAFQNYVNLIGDDNIYVADTLEAIGESLFRMDIPKDAINFTKKSFKISERLLGENHPRLCFILDKLAVMYAKEGELDQAEVYLLKSLEIRKKEFGHHPLVADTLFNFSKIMIQRGDMIKAINYFKRCCAIYYHFIEADSRKARKSGRVGQEVGDGRNPQIMSESALKLQEILQFKYVKSSHTLILLLFNKGNYKECLEEIENLKNIPDKELIEGPILCKVESIKARCHLMLEDYEEAYKVASKSVELFKEEYGEFDPQTADSYFKLGYICKHSGKEDEALVFLTNAMNIAKSISDNINLGDGGNVKFVDLCKKVIEMECGDEVF